MRVRSRHIRGSPLNVMDQETRTQLRLSGECSDLTVQVGTRKFSLHKFPLIVCSDYFKCLVKSGMSDSRSVELNELPGGEATMELIADFCYGLPISLTLENISHVMCAANYLQIRNLTAMCRPKLDQLIEESTSNCFKILSYCIDIELSAEVAGVTDSCTTALVEYLQQIIPGDRPGTMVKQTRQEYTGMLASWNRVSPEPTTEPETIAGWVDEMSHLPIKWTTSVIKQLNAAPRKWDELPTKLTDHLLNHNAAHGSTSGEEFVSLLEASSLAPRKSYGSVFEALEKMMVTERECQTRQVTTSRGKVRQLRSTSVSKSGSANPGNCRNSDGLSDGDIRNILKYIDFSKLSQEALERATQNERIPRDLILKEVLSVCSQLRTQLHHCKCTTIMERISGRWSAENEILEVTHRSTRFDKRELQLRTKRKNGSWLCTPQSIKEGEVYVPISVLPRENSHPENKQQPAAKRKKLVFPVAAENPRVLISSAGDQLLTLRHPNRLNFVQWRKQTD